MAKRASVYEQRAERYEFSLHYLGNPFIERSVPVPQVSHTPVVVEHDGWNWILPNGHAALLAARAAGSISGEAFASKVAELGGERGAAMKDN